MHDVLNNLHWHHFLNISQLLSYSSEADCHNTRLSAAGNIYVKYSRTKRLKISFSILVAKIWNIPNCIRSLPNYWFKRVLHKQLLIILIQEDNYVGVHTLTDKL